MKNHILLSLLACFGMTSLIHAQEIEARCDQLHSVLYAGGNNQAIMRIKIKSNAMNQILKKMSFSMAGTSSIGDVTKARIWSSGSAPFFAPSSGMITVKAIESSLNFSGSKVTNAIEFTGSQALNVGDNYFWLVCDVNSRARGNAAIDASCTEIKSVEETIVPENAAPQGSPKVFPYQFRISPYYRANILFEGSSPLSSQHFSLITDLILCSVGVNADGTLSGTEANSDLMRGLEKIKTMRGKNQVNIILCIMPNAATMANVVADAGKRRLYAKQLADFAKKNGFGGIDLDWENPANATQWYNCALLISDLREELATDGVSGISISIANAIHYMPASLEVCDQLDFLNNMSYDAGGEHSTLALMTGDIAKCQTNAKLPNYKIIAGLPFYSQETASNRDWNQGQGNNNILAAYPNISPSQNTFILPRTGKQHYFNGYNLIQQKVKYVKDNKVGGIMIWAYDRDVPLSNQRSLARAISTILKPTKQ